MDFNKIVYKRVDYNDTKRIFQTLLDKLDSSNSFKEFNSVFKEINKIRSNIKTMSTYVTIKFSINTSDGFYLEEKEYWDRYLPYFESLDNLLYKKIYTSKYKDEMISEYGKHYYKYIETCILSFDDGIIHLLQEENRLMSEYTRLLSSFSDKFNGEEVNLFGLTAYFSSTDERIREEAISLHTEFFEKNEDKFDEIFDKLVNIRHEMAVIMGYKNFIELGYYRMHRTDYDENMVSIFRKNIIDTYLPIVNKIYEEQAKEINQDRINYFNEGLLYLDGNPELIVDDTSIFDSAIRMYNEMSEETGDFINYLISNHLIHVKKEENKALGGYCTILYDYGDPFIFGNFNATLDDVDTLTHEFGHAFQVHMSRHETIPELIFPTLDSCEIFSMTMEVLTYPWMRLFFGDDSKKYIQSHYKSFIKFLPYGCLVDHFQHEIYSNPGYTPKQRKEAWRRLEKVYCPHRVYSNIEGSLHLDFLERGGYWYRQGHIFKNPFYYIDYVLAEFCALEFKKIMDDDWKSAWDKYMKICKLGGRYSFLEIVNEAGLKNPFI